MLARNLLRGLGREIETRAAPPGWSDAQARQWWRMGGGAPTIAGPVVNESTALALSTVYTCVNFKSRLIASLPVALKRMEDDGESTSPAPEHPSYRLLTSRANPRPTTAYQAMQFVVASRLLRGNSIAAVMRDMVGRATEYYPLRWDQITPDVVDAQLVYRWQPHTQTAGAAPQTFTQDQVWVTHGLTANGSVGMSPIALQAESVGWGLALQEFGNRHFANAATPSGVLSTEGTLGKKPEDRDANVARLRSQLEGVVGGGLANARRFMVLEDGLKWQAMGLSPEDSQFLESRRFSRTEIAAWFGIPPHIVGELERATFSNIEQQSLELVIFHLLPDLVDLEQTLTEALLPARERGRYLVKFDVRGLLRGDAAARAAYYARGLTDGWLSPNEVRKAEGLNPVDGLDDYRVPLNMGIIPIDGVPNVVNLNTAAVAGGPSNGLQPTTRAAAGELETRAASAVENRARLAAAFTPVLEAAIGEIVKRETREVRKLVGLVYGAEALKATDARATPAGGRIDPDGFLAAADVLYAADGELRKVIEARARPALRALAAATFKAAALETDEPPDETDLEAYLEGRVTRFGQRYSIASLRSLGHVVRTVGAADAPGALVTLLAGWGAERAGRAASREVVATSRATSRETFRRGGMTGLRWVKRGRSCPFCTQLDGRIVAIDGGAFVGEGEELTAKGRPPLRTAQRTVSPPLHKGCDCEVAPVKL